MPLSTHYYVLSLSSTTNSLFEAFRDSLIGIENHGFPVMAPTQTSDALDDNQILELVRTVDQSFGDHYSLDPLGVIVVGERKMQSAFSSVTTHESAVIGRIEGDHSATPAGDLGMIVWPVAKEAMSGVFDGAMHDLEASAERGQLVFGLEAVARLVNKGEIATLLVEDDYHIRGSIGGTTQAPVISPEVDVREAIDDAVDAVVEKILESGGNVVFMPSGSLRDRDRIVLLLRGEKST